MFAGLMRQAVFSSPAAVVVGGSATTWDAGTSSPNWTLGSGNLTATRSSASTNPSWLYATASKTVGTGSGNFIVTPGSLGSVFVHQIGLSDRSGTNGSGHTVTYEQDGFINYNGANVGSPPTYTNADAITVTLTAAGHVKFAKNGTDVGVDIDITTTLSGLAVYPTVFVNDSVVSGMTDALNPVSW